MNIQFFESLNEGLVSEQSVKRVQQHERQVSVHWELRTLLYLGILLFCSGFGIFIYKNIDTIGHLTIIALIAVLMIVCFVYSVRKKYPYSNGKVPAPNAWADYVLLLGSLLLLTFIGYIQFEYHFFGDRWGMAVFTPAVLLFFGAYYFDHLGILSLAITNLAAWIGIAVSPMQLLRNNDFGNDNIIYSGVLLGILLFALCEFSLRTHIKAHFSATYKNFGFHLFFIAALAGMVHFDAGYALWFLAIAAAVAYQFYQAVLHSSFYFLLFSTLYGYAGLSCLVIRMLIQSSSEAGFVFGIYYFIGSSVGLIILLTRYNKKLHRNDRL